MAVFTVYDEVDCEQTLCLGEGAKNREEMTTEKMEEGKLRC